MAVALTTEEWVARASANPKNSTIDYSQVVYINQSTRVKLYCRKHDHHFTAPPKQHAKGDSGCKFCSRDNRIANRKSAKITAEELRCLIKQKGKGKYTYPDMSTFEGMSTKMLFVCDIHGDRWQTPSNYLAGVHECERCAVAATKSKLRISKNEWMRRIEEKHGKKFSYPGWNELKVEGQNTKLQVICPQHGLFEQQLVAHVRSNGCPKCGDGEAVRKQSDY